MKKGPNTCGAASELHPNITVAVVAGLGHSSFLCRWVKRDHERPPRRLFPVLLTKNIAAQHNVQHLGYIAPPEAPRVAGGAPVVSNRSEIPGTTVLHHFLAAGMATGLLESRANTSRHQRFQQNIIAKVRAPTTRRKRAGPTGRSSVLLGVW